MTRIHGEFFFKLALISIIGLSTACSMLGIESDTKKDAGPQTGVFEDEYDRVWRAAQLALAKYPMRVNNMDAGILETDFIKRAKIWQPPNVTKLPRVGERHKITVRMVKGMSDDDVSAVKVIVAKKMEVLKDFFSEPDKLPSDGFEEKIILYRIGRELSIERKLMKANETLQKED